MDTHNTGPNETIKARRWLLAALVAVFPGHALAQKLPAAGTQAPDPGEKRLRLDQLPASVQARIAGCSTSDRSCCTYSAIQGDLCCPGLKTGPTRANMTDAQFREIQAKFGNKRFVTSDTPAPR